MAHSLLKIVKWFCRQLTYNELASAILIFHEVLNKSRCDIPLKPNEKPPHYRDFRVDTNRPLPVPETKKTADWKIIKAERELKSGKLIKPVKVRNGKELPTDCRCNHCQAPKSYLYLNNGKLGSQVKCKICGQTGAVHNARRKNKTKYCCPYCSKALFKWKESQHSTIYKCPNYQCCFYLTNKNNLTEEEKELRKLQKYNPNFKLHYQYREYHITPSDLETVRPINKTTVDIRNIYHSYHTLGLVLSFSINLGLSSRTTRDALKGLYGISISHQTIINYINASASYLSSFVDDQLPFPQGTCAADETYIIVKGRWNYTWFLIDSETRAICGYNLSQTREMRPALALLYNSFGIPKYCKAPPKLITDGNPSYDAAVLAYNELIEKKINKLIKQTVIGLENLDRESTEYRCFKQLVERLNRTYKYHTRPRAGFKSFNGVVSLTTLFIAFYNFMRPHSAIDHKPPVSLDMLQDCQLMPEKWVKLIIHAA